MEAGWRGGTGPSTSHHFVRARGRAGQGPPGDVKGDSPSGPSHWYPLAGRQCCNNGSDGAGSKALPPKSSLTFALARTPRCIAYGSLFRRALCPCAHATTPPGRQAARPSSYRGLKQASGRLCGARCPSTSPLWRHARRQWLAGDHESTGPLGLFVAKSKEQRRWQVRRCSAVWCG